MAFIPKNFESGRLVEMPASADGSSETFTKGDALVDDGSGFLKNAASGTAVDIKFIAWENKVVSTNGTLLLCYRTVGGVLIEADCDAAPAQTDAHTHADLASVSTVNPDASTNDLFYIEKVNIAGSKVLGHFAEGVPNS